MRPRRRWRARSARSPATGARGETRRAVDKNRHPHPPGRAPHLQAVLRLRAPRRAAPRRATRPTPWISSRSRALPELSTGRVLTPQIERLYQHQLQPRPAHRLRLTRHAGRMSRVPGLRRQPCATRVRAADRRRLRALQRGVSRHHAPRAAALRRARLERQPARRGRAHRAVRPLRQPDDRGAAPGARRARRIATLWRADPRRVRRADHRSARPGVHQDLLQLHQPPAVRHRRRGAGYRVRGHRPRSARQHPSPPSAPTPTSITARCRCYSRTCSAMCASARRGAISTRASRTSPPKCSAYLHARGERREVEKVEVIRPVFYQISRAYIVGRVVGRGFLVPLVIALKNSDGGVLVDAVMLAEGRRQHRLQLHALLFSRRPRARRRGGGVPEVDHAAQAGERAVHGARPRHARARPSATAS